MIRRYCFSILALAGFCLESPAKDLFTITSVKSAARQDSVILTIAGTGDPVFDAYDLGSPERIVINIQNGALPERPVEMTYADPVRRIVLHRDFDKRYMVKLICELSGETSYNIAKDDAGIRLALKVLSGSYTDIDPALRKPHWLKNKVNVELENTPLGPALSMLARQNGFDVVMGEFGAEMVTARLSDVSVGDALSAILGVSGFSYFIVGDIVVVKPAADEAPGELVTRLFKLRYIDSRQIEQQIKNMLSMRGKVQIVAGGHGPGDDAAANFPSNMIAVTDIAGVMPSVEEFVSIVDARPTQIAIGVKLIETNLDNQDSFGFDWSTDITAKITGAQEENQAEGQTNQGLSAYSTLPLKSGSFTYGTLNFSEVAVLLEYLHSNGESRLLSSPSVTTTDGKPAVINVVTTIPIQTINRFTEGAAIQDIVTFQYKDVGISLNVTPIINESGLITLRCKPVVEEITGWVGPADNQQPITSKRSVNTDVIVRNGETLVIGGLMKESVIENTTGVWLLSDIPILGELFKHRSRQNSKTDLMILITPTVLP